MWKNCKIPNDNNRGLCENDRKTPYMLYLTASPAQFNCRVAILCNQVLPYERSIMMHNTNKFYIKNSFSCIKILILKLK